MAKLKTTLQALQLPTAADALNEFLMKAEEKQWTNQELLDRLLTHELHSREHKRWEKHLKLASFPEYLPLEGFGSLRAALHQPETIQPA
jgi:DNA replication protein DnaC